MHISGRLASCRAALEYVPLFTRFLARLACHRMAEAFPTEAEAKNFARSKLGEVDN